jgi:hypothetical protein
MEYSILSYSDITCEFTDIYSVVFGDLLENYKMKMERVYIRIYLHVMVAAGN